MHGDVLINSLLTLTTTYLIPTFVAPVEDLQNGRRQVFFGERTELEQATCHQEAPMTALVIITMLVVASFDMISINRHCSPHSDVELAR